MKKGWELKKIKDLNLSNFKGLSPKVKSEDGDITLIPSGAVFPDGIKLKATKKFLAGSLKLKEKFLSHGDLLFNCGGVGTLGRSMLYNSNSISSKVIADSFVLVIRCNGKDILNSYLFYFFQTVSVKNKIIENTRGTTGITSIRTDAILNLEIPLPSLSEQQRIVAILDEAFAAIAIAKANAEKNLKNAKELFESYLQGVFENKGEDWEEKTLGDVCSLYQGIAINAKTKHALVEKSDLPLLRIKDLRNNSEEQYIDPNNYPKNALVNEEDILYTRTGNSLGLVFRGRRGVLHNNSFKIVPNQSLSRDFLFIWLQNPIFKSKIFELAYKAAQPDITHAIFKLQEIAIPPIIEQNKIVKNLNALSTETIKLEAIYQQKINDLEELKKSVLQKAFSGELKI